MKLDVTAILGPTEVGGFVQRAEAAGVDGLMLAEMQHEVFVGLTVAALASTRLELTSGVAIALARSPMVLAQQAWDIQRLSGGRLRIGLGSQVKAHITSRFGMTWDKPAAQMREFVQAVRAIWTCWQDDVPLRFAGRYYRHWLMTPAFNPGPIPQGPPPILLAGVGKLMIRVAAETADGLITHPLTSLAYLDDVIRPAIARRRPDGAGPFELCTQVMVATGRTADEVATNRAAVARQIAFYASTPAYRGVLDHHGLGGFGEEAGRLARDGQWEAMGELVTDDIFDLFAISGDPDSAGRALLERCSGRVDRIGVNLPGAVAPDVALDVVAAARRQAG
ncbi:MAG: TIGR03617 family F420-dependent LLM class oxidoreductase [Tetrasphaera sp.]